MSQPVETQIHKYVGDGSTTDFTYNFTIASEDEIVVLLNGTVVSDTAYIVNTVDTQIEMDVAPEIDDTFILCRNTELSQPFSFGSSDFTLALDNLERQIQDISEEVGRSFKAAPEDFDADYTMPSPLAGYAIGWNQTENGLTNLPVADGTLIGATQYKELQTATAGQTVFVVTTIPEVLSSTNTAIYIQGAKQYSTAYSITDSYEVTFNEGLDEGDVVEFVTGEILGTATIAEAHSVPYTSDATTTVGAKLDITASRYATVAAAQADVANIVIGNTIYLEDRGAYFKCVAYSSPDGFGDVDGDGSTKMFQLQVDDTVSFKNYGAVDGGVVDSILPIQAALSSGYPISDTGSYLVSGTLDIDDTFAGIESSGLTIITNSSDLILSGQSQRYTATGLSTSITAGDETITVPGGFDVSVGDVIIATNTFSERIAGYNNGVLARVDSVSGTTVTLSHPVIFSDTIDTITSYKAINDATIKGVTFDCSGVDDSKGLSIIANNFTLENTKIIGRDTSHYGGVIIGVGNKADNVTATGFFDSSEIGVLGRLGYGLAISGHDSYVIRSELTNCKHCFTGSDRLFISSNIGCFHSRLSQDASKSALTDGEAPLDIHANSIDTHFARNYIFGNKDLVAFRGISGRVHDNEFTQNDSSESSSLGFSFWEDDKDGLKIYDNKFTFLGGGDVFRERATSYPNFELKNTYFKNNEIRGAGIQLLTLESIDNLFIQDNKFIGLPSTGIRIDTNAVTAPVSNIAIEGNTIDYGNTSFGIGVYTDFDASTVIDKPILINRNTFISGASASDNIRISTLNKHIINGNMFDGIINDLSTQYTYYPIGNVFSDTSIVTGHTWKGGTKLRRVQDNDRLYAGSAPASGAWIFGDIVYDETPSASGFIGWVCVSSGSPGTWKTFGVISA